MPKICPKMAHHHRSLSRARTPTHRDMTVRFYNDEFQASLETPAQHYFTASLSETTNNHLPHMFVSNEDETALLLTRVRATTHKYIKRPSRSSHDLFGVASLINVVIFKVTRDSVRLVPEDIRAVFVRTEQLTRQRNRAMIYEHALNAAVKWASRVTNGAASIPDACAAALRHELRHSIRRSTTTTTTSSTHHISQKQTLDRIRAVLADAERGYVYVTLYVSDHPIYSENFPVLAVVRETGDRSVIIPDASMFLSVTTGSKYGMVTSPPWEDFVTRKVRENRSHIFTNLTDRPKVVFFRGRATNDIRSDLSRRLSALSSSTSGYSFDVKVVAADGGGGGGVQNVDYYNAADQHQVCLDLVGLGNWAIRTRELALAKCIAIRAIPTMVQIETHATTGEIIGVTRATQHTAFVHLLIRDGIDNHTLHYNVYYHPDLDVGTKNAAVVRNLAALQSRANEVLAMQILETIREITEPNALEMEQARANTAFKRARAMTMNRLSQFMYNAMVRLVTANLMFSESACFAAFDVMRKLRDNVIIDVVVVKQPAVRKSSPNRSSSPNRRVSPASRLQSVSR